MTMEVARVTPIAAASFVLLACAATQSVGGFGADAAAVANAGADAGGLESGAGDYDAGGVPDVAQEGPSADVAGPASGSYDDATKLAGSYAMLIKFRKVISLNGGSLGSFNALVSIYSNVQIAADSANHVVTLSAGECHMDIAGTGTIGLQGATFQVADVIMTTTHLDPATLSVAGDGGAAAWSLSELHGPIGWKWSSPADSTPTSATDPRVFDQDMDSMPGVTMHVLWNGTDTPMDFVQTQREQLSGQLAAGGALTGTTVDAGDQNIIGNTSALGGASVTWASDPNTADNTVRIVPVTSPLTCAELMAQTTSLFP
jgi:hypothetical protein